MRATLGQRLEQVLVAPRGPEGEVLALPEQAGKSQKAAGERALLDSAVTPPPSLVGILDEVHEQRTKAPNFFRPSMLSGCDRANVFHYLRVPHHPPRQDGRMQRILDTGSAVHTLLQEYLSDHPDYYFAKEARVLGHAGQALIRGSCDGVLIRRSDGYRFGVEIKTIAPKGFEDLRRPKPEHVQQFTIYLALQNLAWGVVLYFNKGNQELKEYAVPCDPALWQKLRERAETLYGFIERRSLPLVNPKTCNRLFCQSVEYCDRMVEQGK